MPEGVFKPLEFDVGNPVLRPPHEEWKPHARMSEKTFEWWYITFLAYDESGNRYFVFLSIWTRAGEGWFRRLNVDVPEGGRIFGAFGQISDYSRSRHMPYSKVTIRGDDEIWNRAEHAVAGQIGDMTAFWSWAGDEMKLKTACPEFEMDFTISNLSEIFWHKDALGIEGLIQQGAEDDFSFYYSIPRCEVGGVLTLKEPGAPARRLRLAGSAWIDRQWGDFYTLDWEWTSFRFDNGARVHLYNFFNGRQEGLYVSAEGEVTYFRDVTVRQNGYAKSPKVGIWVSWGWSYEFPIEIEGSRKYTSIPLSNLEFMEDERRQFALFEGGCRLINDETGEQVGMSVNESADIRNMRNGPFDQHQR